MIPYNKTALNSIAIKNIVIPIFDTNGNNIDEKTVESFGNEWHRFNTFTDKEITETGDEYFDIITEDMLNLDSIVLDVGCGSGRWSKYVAPKAKFIEAIDPSDSVFSAALLLQDVKNIRLTKASTDNIPFEDNSFDFVFSLGVLHHIPDTQKAMKDCVNKVKKKGYFMVYLYYNLDNRSFLYRTLFSLSNFFRKIISSLPQKLKITICDLIAVFIYMPFVFFSKLIALTGIDPKLQQIPLSYYVNKSFNIIRNDALDRFGTPLEQRFSRKEISTMMEQCGLQNIIFSNKSPFWHAVGQKV